MTNESRSFDPAPSTTLDTWFVNEPRYIKDVLTAKWRQKNWAYSYGRHMPLEYLPHIATLLDGIVP